MNEINVSHGAIATPIKIAIGYAFRIRITLLENGSQPASVSGWTWRMILKRFPGDRQNILDFTLGNGLRYEIYSDTVLIADGTAAQTLIEEGEYYLAFIRTDLPRPMIEAKAILSYSSPDL